MTSITTPYIRQCTQILGTKNLIMDNALVRPVIKVAGISGSLAKRSRNRWLIQAGSHINLIITSFILNNL